MGLPLVVGVDGSESSLLAVDWAADEAILHGLPLRLVYASLWERYEGWPPSAGRSSLAAAEGSPDRTTAGDIVAVAVERARRRAPDLAVESAALPDDPVHALLREGHNAAALVTGCRGRGDLQGLLLGSVCLAVAGRAAGPVIVVRGDPDGVAGTRGRVVLGVGGPGTSGAATRFALREAEVRTCALDVVRTWRHPAHQPGERPLPSGNTGASYEEQASALVDGLLEEAMTDHPGVLVHRRVVEGPARTVLLQQSAAADLLVVGVARRRGWGGLQLGRVTHTMLHHARCPVAVVPDFP
ncbi:universal stress protein [Streptomyces pluripotens]|uniref:Universal stress protein n=1 Tax=Streptomyces pluripotens TaxID=1355015 RepID=A0A221NSK7_9ACTN|nr:MULTISPECIES: universal stress protein [Streptomyces]ARP68632.1 universal stress protein [Streptomyces pluripotens]ASN22892.1 universal stress protein [Streptomyces pluripotens]KIE26731.1 universal stress protein [Streptomyces sp. MUSC 125]MCH0559278.1 universal stress protein [Streptomyces sp. MUM 16J]